MSKVEQIEEFFSLRDAAKYAHMTYQAIHEAITRGKLTATKVNGKWHIFRHDLDNYRANRYNRQERKQRGVPVYDAEKGEFSVQQICKIISHQSGVPFPDQKLYYLLRKGIVKSMRKGAAWVIPKEEAARLMVQHMEQVHRKMGMA